MHNVKQDNYHRQVPTAVQTPFVSAAAAPPLAVPFLHVHEKTSWQNTSKTDPADQFVKAAPHVNTLGAFSRTTVKHRLLETETKGTSRKNIFFPSTHIIIQHLAGCVDRARVKKEAAGITGSVFNCMQSTRREALTAEQESAEHQDSGHPSPGPIHSPQGRRHPLW